MAVRTERERDSGCSERERRDAFVERRDLCAKKEGDSWREGGEAAWRSWCFSRGMLKRGVVKEIGWEEEEEQEKLARGLDGVEGVEGGEEGRRRWKRE
eukprot:2965400-Pleurochrysis_carterae.AAC.1